uniref:RRM domain-containing protein n=1 Tax=Parascaris univalens TaxID=6257 RepID=A0A915CDT4_PARUN
MDFLILAVLFCGTVDLASNCFSLIFRFDVCFMGVAYVRVVKRAQKISIGSEEKINMITLLYKKRSLLQVLLSKELRKDRALKRENNTTEPVYHKGTKPAIRVIQTDTAVFSLFLVCCHLQ